MGSISVNEDDRLSNLPEDILSQILSLVPMKFLVQTSILSKWWRYIWTSVTNLDFDDTHRVKNLTKFVDGVMEFRGTSQVKLFRLHLPNTRVPGLNVSRWVDKAVKLNVQEIDVDVIHIMLPISMFHCKTLTKLKLNHNKYDQSDWKCPSSCLVYLPSLKTFDVVVNKQPLYNVFKVIRGCPILESLSLEVLCYRENQNYVFNTPTLKRLKLILPGGNLNFNNKVVLKVPNLKYLILGGVLSSSIVVEDISSLVEASFAFSDIPYADYLLFPKTLVPACMLTNVTTINFIKCKGQNCVIQFLEYTLANAVSLETLTISWEDVCHDEEMKLRARLLAVPRASQYCEIHFI